MSWPTRSRSRHPLMNGITIIFWSKLIAWLINDYARATITDRCIGCDGPGASLIGRQLKAKLDPEDIPDLIMFSNMQFDQARSRGSGNWESHHQRIVRWFKEKGSRTCGKAWPAPHIVYWNLSGKIYIPHITCTTIIGFSAQANTPVVTMLSGYSPS